MKRKSSLIGVAALALLLTSALPVGAGKATQYKMYFECTNPAASQLVYETSYWPTRHEARARLNAILADQSCVKGTLDWSIKPFYG